MAYCIDTSSLLEGWERFYPHDVFPGLWTKLEALVQAGQLIAPEEVRIELEKKSDGAIRWAKRQRGLFVPVDDAIQLQVATILAAHPRLVDSKKGRNAADAFVIALARMRSATVVTQESMTAKDKVPEVCRALGVPCINLVTLIRNEHWVFPA